MSRCCLISSPSLHSSSLTILSSGLCISSSSLLRLTSVPELAIVALLTLPVELLLRFFFLNQLRFDFEPPSSVSDTDEGRYSTRVGSVLELVLRWDGEFEESLARLLGSRGSAESSAGLYLGVGTGVISVEGVTSTSSASRYHFRRRV